MSGSGFVRDGNRFDRAVNQDSDFQFRTAFIVGGFFHFQNFAALVFFSQVGNGLIGINFFAILCMADVTEGNRAENAAESYYFNAFNH